MASRSHHVAAVTPDPDAVIAFLRDVIGLDLITDKLSAPSEAATHILGWPAGNPGVKGAMLGRGPGGIVEVIGIPPELRATVPAGFALISFATPDLEDRVEHCRAAGIEVSDVIRTQGEGLDLSGAVAKVGGLSFELLRFES
jgi:catechol 2,3-dioxygenase-like lactoylglutathione lyase family enzyme